MPEVRQGAIGVLRTIKHEFAFLPVPDEDHAKAKEERILPKGIWRKIVPGMLGSISEAVKAENPILPDNPRPGFTSAIKRSAKNEFGLHLQEGQILGVPQELGKVEQKRNGNLVSFDVWLCNICLSNAQLRKDGIAIASSEELLKFLAEKKRQIRPSTIMAVLRVYETEMAANWRKNYEI